MAQEIGALIQHPTATINSDGITAAEVRVEVGTVTTAFIAAALKVSVLVEDDLQYKLVVIHNNIFGNKYQDVANTILQASNLYYSSGHSQE